MCWPIAIIQSYSIPETKIYDTGNLSNCTLIIIIGSGTVWANIIGSIIVYACANQVLNGIYVLIYYIQQKDIVYDALRIEL